MMKSRTSSDLRKLDTTQPTAEWLKNPINVGSIYIKPTNDEKTYSQCIFQYCWWYWCCGSCRK